MPAFPNILTRSRESSFYFGDPAAHVHSERGLDSPAISAKEKMETETDIDVAALIEKQPMGWFQVNILLNVCAVMFIEGYDMQVTSYAAPAIMKEWHLTSAYFGPVFGFGLFGYLLGGTILSYLGDRFGRKKVILAGSFLFGIFTLLAAYATSLTGLLVLRFFGRRGPWRLHSSPELLSRWNTRLAA